MNAMAAVQILRDTEGLMSVVRSELKKVSEQGAHITREAIHELAGKLEAAEQQVSGLREAIEGPKSGPVVASEPELTDPADPMKEPASIGGPTVGGGDELTDDANEHAGDGTT
jgi:hypothetical protein